MAKILGPKTTAPDFTLKVTADQSLRHNGSFEYENLLEAVNNAITLNL